jgi:hypothetical protein
MIIFLLSLIVFLLLILVAIVTVPQEQRKSLAITLGIGLPVGAGVGWLAIEYGGALVVLAIQWLLGLHLLGVVEFCGVAFAISVAAAYYWDRRTNKKIRAGDELAIVKRKEHLMTSFKYTQEQADAAIKSIRSKAATGKEERN